MIHRKERHQLKDFRPFFDTSICSLGYGEMLAKAHKSMAYKQTLEFEEQKLARFMEENERGRLAYFD
jgi:hypothetical protein